MIAIREIDNDESTARRASTSFRNTGVCEFETLRQSISRIEKGLGRLKPLRSSVTGIETEVSRIRGYTQDIEVELRGSFGELGGLAAA